MSQLFIKGKTFWAWNPEHEGHHAGISLFKRIVECDSEEPFHLAISADNRYTLFLDGKVLGRGPARSSLEHYCYEEYSGKLPAGRHIFAVEVLVWNDVWRESNAAWGEMHAGGGLMTAGYAGNERLEQPENWFVKFDRGRRPLSWRETWDSSLLNPAPPMDLTDFRNFDSFWTVDPDTTGFVQPFIISHAEFSDGYIFDQKTPWLLEKRRIKMMSETFLPIEEIMQSDISSCLDNGILKMEHVPAGKSKILLNIGKYSTFMVHFSGRGGFGKCRIAYAESFYDEAGHRFKTPAGKVGRRWMGDQIIFPATEKNWVYNSFWYRAGQFIELEFDLEKALENVEFKIDFITYPFAGKKTFSAPDDPMAEKIYEIAWNTLLCCTHETFEDCPYYEQLQYAGDSRMHALASYAMTGDDSMGRQLLRALKNSLTPGGLTCSRYPSSQRQVIPNYSLIWILSIEDHFKLYHDIEFLRELYPAVETVLGVFERNKDKDGLTTRLEGWHFTDWTKDWYLGCSDRQSGLPETIMNLFYALACRAAVSFCRALDIDGTRWLKQQQITVDAVNRNCFNRTFNRYSDVPGKEWFSLHVNIMALLAGAVSEEKKRDFLAEILADEKLTQPTLYFEFYILSAIKRYGTDGMFEQRLEPWKKLIKEGYTTFPERPFQPFRSECHAWSIAPVWFMCGEKKAEE